MLERDFYIFQKKAHQRDEFWLGERDRYKLGMKMFYKITMAYKNRRVNLLLPCLKVYISKACAGEK